MNTKIRFHQGLDYLLSHVEGFGVDKVDVANSVGTCFVNICFAETQYLLTFDDSVVPSVWKYRVFYTHEQKEFLTVQDLALYICNLHGLDYVFSGSVVEDVNAQLIDYPFKIVNEDADFKQTRLIFSPALQTLLLTRMTIKQREKAALHHLVDDRLRQKILKMNERATSRPPVSNATWRDHVYGKGASS